MTLPLILESLPVEALLGQAQTSAYPKWGTLCLLRYLGLPTLKAAFLGPNASLQLLHATLSEFAARTQLDRVLVRSDGGRERTKYVRGGNSHTLESAGKLAEALVAAGRAVIFMEPTIRFENRLTANILISRSSGITIEILGPGYDTADLNRGQVLPYCQIDCFVQSWQTYEELGLSDIKVSISTYGNEFRIRQRLRHLGEFILPAAGITVHGDYRKFAENWLRRNNFLSLFDEWSYNFDMSQIRHWHETAFIAAQLYECTGAWDLLVLSWSKLDSGRCIYWDVVDARTKYHV